jgi:hypothetical protein
MYICRSHNAHLIDMFRTLYGTLVVSELCTLMEKDVILKYPNCFMVHQEPIKVIIFVKKDALKLNEK